MKKSIKIFIILGFVIQVNAQVVLEANGPGNTYELINSVLAPNGGNVVEHPECVHPEFERHITEVWDSELNQHVFAFHIHVTPDNDRCINFDRQRMEIKTYDASPANLKGTHGETIVYKWKFRLPVGFQPSANFTHLHQIKAVGGDADDPLFVLTARKGNPNKMELNYYVDSDLNSEKLTSVNLSLFEGNWVEVTERIRVDNINGTYSIEIKNVSTAATILSYSNNKMLTIRADNSFIRPKWGIYRSLLNAQDLRDEIVLFNSFSIQEEQNTANIQYTDDEMSEFSVCQQSNSNKLIVDFFTKKNNLIFQILNTNGQIIKTVYPAKDSLSERQKIEVDISNLNTGVYIARLITDNKINTTKFLVLR
jgi:hypothetical protein